MKAILFVSILLTLVFAVISFRADQRYSEMRFKYESVVKELEVCRQINYENSMMMMQLFGHPDTVNAEFIYRNTTDSIRVDSMEIPGDIK